MGKFGNKSLPKFMKHENDMPIGEGSATIHELQEGHSEPEIVSLGDADGGDFITITVKTVEGEEVALEFKLDDDREETEEEGIYKGTLYAEHNDVEYTINCEIEEAGNGDYDIKIGDVTADMDGAGMDDESTEIDESRVLRFGQFMNESMDGYEEDEDELPHFDHEPLSEGAGCSSEAKAMIESMCNEYLIQEGMAYQEDEDDSHTYEGYTQACMEYLKSCMTKEGQY